MELATLRDADLSALVDGAAAWRAYGDVLWDNEEGAQGAGGGRTRCRVDG